MESISSFPFKKKGYEKHIEFKIPFLWTQHDTKTECGVMGGQSNDWKWDREKLIYYWKM